MTTQPQPSRVSEQVREFHETYNCAIAPAGYLGLGSAELRAMRTALLQEEFDEYCQAMANDDVVEVADALADMVYVIYGAALSFGIPLDAVIDEVHRSNMSKLGEDGKVIYREDLKVLKGPNYFKPDIIKVLNNV